MLQSLAKDKDAPVGPRMSAAERGFETAQLHTRHWIISKSDGPPDHVNGAGVVGRFPLFREGGWREDKQVDASGRIRSGEECEGIFVYQSMSGRGGPVAFEGELNMVPGSIQQPTGDEFTVQVGRFPLTCDGSDFLF